MLRRSEAGLTYPQVFLLVIGFGLASGIIFLFGIWVGRYFTELRLAQEERVVRQPVPVQPTPAEETRESDVDRTFYEKIKEKAVQRLQATAAIAPSPTMTRNLPPASPTRAATSPVERPTAGPTLPPVAKHTEPPLVDQEWADAGWTVQVNATTDPEQATELARRLKSKGYDAYTVQAPMRGQTWYRVRVGRFASRARAKDVEDRLKAEEGLENAYVTPQ